jgi:ABC-type Fe3+-siderophore transport system permease subunit
MEQAGGIIALVGVVLGAVGGIWFLVTVFRESILWGLLCLFTGVASLIFLVLYWRESRKPFFIWLAGTVIAFVGRLIHGSFW